MDPSLALHTPARRDEFGIVVSSVLPLRRSILRAMEGTELKDETAATGAETRKALLDRARWLGPPISNHFVQLPRGKASDPRPGKLGPFVNNGDKRGLLAYLFLLSIISSGSGPDGWSTTLPSRTWARALGTDLGVTDAAAITNAVTKVFRRLDTRGLIKRETVTTPRGDRQVRVSLLSIDGSGSVYARPTSHFFQLHRRFWDDGWHEKLGLPAIAMLLVLLKEKPWVPLPTERMPDWYGWSADTADRGFSQLLQEQLAEKRLVAKKEPLSPTGLTRTAHYNLTPILAPPRPRTTASGRTDRPRRKRKKSASKLTSDPRA